MTEKIAVRPLVRAAVAAHGVSYALVGAGAILMVLSIMDRLVESRDAWAIYGFLAGLGCATFTLGVVAVAAAVSHKGPARSWPARLTLAFCVVIVLYAMLLLSLDSVAQGSLGVAKAGAFWIVAGTLGPVATLFWRRPRVGPPHAAAALGLVAVGSLLMGYLALDQMTLFPRQQWHALQAFHAGPGTLAAVAVALAITTMALTERAGSWPTTPVALAGLAGAGILYGIATAIPAFGFLMDVSWHSLTSPGDAFPGEPVLAMSLFALTAAFCAWITASVLTLLAGVVALKATGRGLADTLQALRGPRKPRRHEGERLAPPSLTCPKCGATAQFQAEQRPICPSCWYAGPS